MHKHFLPVAVAAVLALSGCSAANDSAGSATGSSTDASTQAAAKPTPTATPTPEVPNLSGEWKQTNAKSDDGWMNAVITDGTVTANFVTDGGDTVSLFWVGSYTAPSDDTQPYTWTSTRDRAATDSALLASTDDTKDFVYDHGELRFTVTIQGSTATVRLSKV